jgi:hypothetical protein
MTLSKIKIKMKNLIKKISSYFGKIATLFLLTISVFFLVNNRSEVEISILPFSYSIKTKLYLLIFASFLIGFFSAWLIFFRKIIRNFINNFLAKKEILKLKKTVNDLEKKDKNY